MKKACLRRSRSLASPGPQVSTEAGNSRALSDQLSHQWTPMTALQDLDEYRSLTPEEISALEAAGNLATPGWDNVFIYKVWFE